MAFNNPLKDLKGIAGNLGLGGGKFKEGIDRLKGQGKQAWENRGTFAQDIWSARQSGAGQGPQGNMANFNNPLDDLRGMGSSFAGSPLGVAMSRIFGERDKGIDYQTSGGPGSLGFGGEGEELTQEDIDYDALVGRNQEEDPSLTGSGYMSQEDLDDLIGNIGRVDDSGTYQDLGDY